MLFRSGVQTCALPIWGETTLGAEGPEGFAPEFLIDLEKEYTGKVEGYVIESLTFTPDAAGDDFAVTTSQWATN